MEAVEQFVARNATQFVDDLKALLRIPSVSADPAYQPDVLRCAEATAEQLRRAGLNVEIVPTAGHPIVYGSRLGKASVPTVLIYGHYDVQPADPFDQWTTPPFEPTERDGCLYARGATDDKGQVLTHVKALQAWFETTGDLPVNVHFVIEGEEEVGSKNLDEFLTSRQIQLKSDVAVVSDTSQYGPGQPAITYGLRGILACEVTLRGPQQDLHSGVFGGAVLNPVNALARLIASLHDDAGRIQIAGFYDDVLELTATEREQFAALPFSEAAFQQSLGIAETWGEAGFTTLERRWARPTCDINGILGGYQGAGPKTIIPASATAKITCRLVPNQNPEALTKALEQHLRDRCPAACRLEFTSWHGADGLVFDPHSRYMQAAQTAITRAFGVAPVFIREGGTIPVVKTFKDVLGLDTLLLGWGQNTDNLHSPNEHFSLADYQRGILASACLWGQLAILT